jgi:hypothetical protein
VDTSDSNRSPGQGKPELDDRPVFLHDPTIYWGLAGLSSERELVQTVELCHFCSRPVLIREGSAGLVLHTVYRDDPHVCPS